MSNIHLSAVIHETARIGQNVTIGPFCEIEEDVAIGDSCVVQSHAVLKSGTRLGNRVTVAHGAILGSKPQDLKFKDEKTFLEVGDDTVIREFATLNLGTDANWKTVIGKNCLIMSYVHVAHDCIIGNNVVIANAVNMAGHVQIEDFVGIGGAALIHQFCRIGQHSFVGGGSRVNKDIPPFIKAMGEPLRFGGTNAIGLTRKGFSEEQLHHIKKTYQKVYLSGLPVKKAVEALKDTGDMDPETRTIVDFIEKAERGIIRAGVA